MKVNPKSIITVTKRIPHKDRLHPTQKPTELFEYLIKTYTNENDLVLDNCAGSRTTAIAALNTNRNYICMEKDENYYNIGFSKESTQEGLGIKTYQSDLFNNWINKETIWGSNGINTITAIDTSAGYFNIDTLNLANKVYNMLNRIAMSGSVIRIFVFLC